MRGAVVIWVVALLAGPAKATDGEGGKDADRPVVGWFDLVVSGPSVSGMAKAAILAGLRDLRELPVEWVETENLLQRLRQRDRREGLLAEAGKRLKKGRKLHLGLKLEQAKKNYQQAIATMEGGFARYYAPDMLAEPLLQLGVAQYQSGDRKTAHKTFMRVAVLAPRLQLAEGYYSPSIRKAFREAEKELGMPEPGVPGPAELARICEAASLQALLVVSQERLGDRPLLRLSLFDARKRSFAAVETAVIAEQDVEATGRDLAERLRSAVSAVTGVRLAPAVEPEPDGGVALAPDGGVEDVVEEISPWYARHWWIWPVAAVVVGAAVALPLTVFREDVVDVRVRY